MYCQYVFRIAEYLLKEGADPDLQDTYGGAVKMNKDNFFYVQLDGKVFFVQIVYHVKRVNIGYTLLQYWAPGKSFSRI